MNKPKVFITRKWPASVEAKLKQHYDVTLNADDRPLSSDKFKLALQEYDAVCPTASDSFPADVLNVANKRCKILANFGVGYNHIDIELLTPDNVSLLPHLGSATLSTKPAMAEKALSNLAAFFAGTPLPDQVI